MSDSILLTGEALRKFVFEEQVKITALSENHIYRKSIGMVSGDAGVGKSSYLANMIRDFSLGKPVFNFFHVPKPVISYYIPFERGAYEVADRLRALSSVMEPDWNNIIIKPDFIGFDMFDMKQATYFVDKVRYDLDTLKERGLEVVVYFDPIISMVTGEIKEEKYAKAITRVANIIQTNSDCAIQMTNHTTKVAAAKKKMVKDGAPSFDPFYGSQAFKAFCTTGSFVIRNKENGIDVYSTKSSHGNVLPHFYLAFDLFTYSLFGKVDTSGLKNYDKVLATVRAIKANGLSAFTFSDILKNPLCSNVSPTSAKEIILHEEPFKSGVKPITGVGYATMLHFTNKWST